jgi:two-component system, OmpR family, response regulator ChvI
MDTIILVDDDQDILDPLEEMLKNENFRVRSFIEPQKALTFLKAHSADLAIFDIKMPELGGFQLLQEVRALQPDLPIIFLSSKTEHEDQIIGFTLGADDFVTKPYNKYILLFRIKAVLKRHSANTPYDDKPVEVGSLKIDRERHLVTWEGKLIELTVTECLLLISLAERPGTVKKRGQLMDAAYQGMSVADRTIDSHVRNIRKKFKDADAKAELIKTVHGLGYKLEK